MPSRFPPLEGYERRRAAGRSVYFLAEYGAALEKLGFMEGRSSEQPIGVLEGRRPHPVYRLPGSEIAVLWKSCSRGGLMEPLLGDRHWRVQRFFDELRVVRAARAAGLGVAELLALAIQDAGSGWKRVEIIARVEEGSRDLAAALTPSARDFPFRQALGRSIAHELRRFHSLGFLHGDLNVKNILWRAARDGTFAVTLIDLDLSPARIRLATPLSNLLRLYRSIRKGEVAGDWRLSTTDLYRFLSEYFQGDRNGVRHFWREGRRRLRRLHPRAAARRAPAPQGNDR